jgi:hypothetical protein
MPSSCGPPRTRMGVCAPTPVDRPGLLAIRSCAGPRRRQGRSSSEALQLAPGCGPASTADTRSQPPLSPPALQGGRIPHAPLTGPDPMGAEMLLSAAGGLPGAHLRTFLRRGPRLGPRAQVVGMAVRRGRDIELPVPLLWVRPDTLEEAVERGTWGVPQTGQAGAARPADVRPGPGPTARPFLAGLPIICSAHWGDGRDGRGR